jgi:DNA-binding transcriptional LysR family regulator
MGQRLADLTKGEADIAIRGGSSGGNEALVGIKIATRPGVFMPAVALSSASGARATSRT